MSKEEQEPLFLIIAILVAVYVLISGVLFLFKPTQWTRSRWSPYPKQFLYLLDYPLGRVQVRVLGIIFSVLGYDFLMFFVYRLAGIKYGEPLSTFTLPMPLLGVIAIITGLLGIVAPRWMFDPRSDNSRNRVLYKSLLRVFGAISLIQGLIWATSGTDRPFHTTLERVFTPALLTAMLAILGYVALNGVMYYVRPKEWARSRFSLAVRTSPEDVDTGKALSTVRIQGLMPGDCRCHDWGQFGVIFQVDQDRSPRWETRWREKRGEKPDSLNYGERDGAEPFSTTLFSML